VRNIFVLVKVGQPGTVTLVACFTFICGLTESFIQHWSNMENTFLNYQLRLVAVRILKWNRNIYIYIYRERERERERSIDDS
jgi:hypothetical protein